MEEFLINKAPGKNLIPLIIEKQSFDHLLEFYNIRVAWYGYPLVHDRFVTYGIFDDLLREFPKEKETISKFVDFSIEIAKNESEEDEKFLNAIFLIVDFCNLGNKLCRPTLSQFQAFQQMKERVQRNSNLPNMTCFWDQIIKFCNTSGYFNSHSLKVYVDDYERFLKSNISALDKNILKSDSTKLESLINEWEAVIGKFAVALKNLDLESIAELIHPDFKFTYRIVSYGHGITTDVRYIGHLFKTFTAMKKEGNSVELNLVSIFLDKKQYTCIKIYPPHVLDLIFPMQYQVRMENRSREPNCAMFFIFKVTNGLIQRIKCHSMSELQSLYEVGEFNEISNK